MTDMTELVLFCAALLIMLILFLFTLYLTLFKFIPAIKSIGLRKSLFKYKFSVAWSLIILSALLALYIHDKSYEFNTAEGNIPAKIHISKVISSGMEGFYLSGGGGCVIEVSKLTDETMHEIKTQGINYFDGALTSRYEDETHHGHKFQKWEALESLDFSGSEGSDWFRCNEIDGKLSEKLAISAKKFGGYVTYAQYTTLVVLPDLGLIVYTYYQ